MPFRIGRIDKTSVIHPADRRIIIRTCSYRSVNATDRRELLKNSILVNCRITLFASVYIRSPSILTVMRDSLANIHNDTQTLATTG